MTGPKARLEGVFRAVLGNPELRRVQLAFFGYNSAELAVWIAIAVYAYGRGGATEAGLVAMVQLVPAAVFGPFPAVLADRVSPARVLDAGYALQAAALAATAAALFAGSSKFLVYALAALATTLMTTTRPAQAALVPALARRPEELTAANVLSGWNDSVSALAGPALAGLLLAVGGPKWVAAVMAVVMLASAAIVTPLTAARPDDETAAADEDAAAPLLDEILAGFVLVKRDAQARLLMFLLAAQFLAIGAFNVITVVIALKLVGLGEGGAGYLSAAYGFGGALSIVLTASLVGRPRLVPALIGASLAWGAALLVLGSAPNAVGALFLLAGAGAARALYDVAGNTLLQRSVSWDVVSRVFGVLEGVSMLAMAAGALLVPLLVSTLGTRAAVVGTGLVLPLAFLLCGRRALQIDAGATVPVVEIALLRAVPFFQALPAPQIEGVARALVPVDAVPGQVLIREGEAGDRFYVIAEGEVEVTAAGRHVATLRRADAFGEIALLRNVPRVATCTALTPVSAYALDREPFLTSIGGHRSSARALGRLVDRRLAELEEIAGPAQT